MSYSETLESIAEDGFICLTMTNMCLGTLGTAELGRSSRASISVVQVNIFIRVSNVIMSGTNIPLRDCMTLENST